MNLAEIRKKAVRVEAPAQAPKAVDAPKGVEAQEASAEVPAAPVPPVSEPEFEDAGFLLQPEPEPAAPSYQAPEPEPAAPRIQAPQPADPEPVPQPSRPAWQAEPDQGADLYQYEGDVDDEFDPVAVILRGRDSASFEAETLQEEVADAASVELLCFRVASEEYAISIMDIKEIIKPREVTEVPRVPSFVRGILSLRGNIIPVFDMKTRLGLDDGAVSERERIVVVKHQSGYAGVAVDEVVQVVRIAEGGIEPPPVVLEGIDREFVLGIGRVGGRMLILLDMEKVLDVGLL